MPPLDIFRLDDLKHEDLIREAQERIARFDPTWTDFNRSDPGMTLVDVFAMFTEEILVRLHRVPERNYLKFLRLLGMQVGAAQAAGVDVTFLVKERAAEVAESIPVHTQVQGKGTDGTPVVFETDRALDVLPYNLTAMQVNDGNGFRDLAKGLNAPVPSPFWVFGSTPRAGCALYLGFGPAGGFKHPGPVPPVAPAGSTPSALRIPPEVSLRFDTPALQSGEQPRPYSVVPQPPPRLEDSLRGIFRRALTVLDASSPATGGAAAARQLLMADLRKLLAGAPTAPATTAPSLHWEARSGTRWARLAVADDGTQQFGADGYVRLQMPRAAEATVEGQIGKPYFWIRCRLASGAFPSGVAPRLERIRVNSVSARARATISDEMVGESDGQPDQEFVLDRRPIEPGSLKLVSAPRGAGQEIPFGEEEDLRAKTGEDACYELDPVAGQIRFGDGNHGRIPPAGSVLIARSYRHGGGETTNVAALGVDTIRSPLKGIDRVTNDRSATGGKNQQEIRELKAEAPGRLRRVSRAVTKQDFESVAKEVGGVSRASAMEMHHPRHPNVSIPGCVTVLVVPDAPPSEGPPVPPAELLRRVGEALESRRLIGTEVHVASPRFRHVTVVAKVEAHPSASLGQVRQGVEKAIDKHLSPLADSPRDFGRDFPVSELFRVILGLESKSAVAVPALRVIVDGVPYESHETVVLQPHELLYPAPKHEINVVPEVDR